ncbi:hypothetical protein PFDG_04872 [Plasmodium falciparum Dd2]|uniref:Uncharacterized protein n=1 Tax=Plasmodium falciparum (isolate Dd2) TaxID=57267 RepID=A0A0L7M901_PLAF4|nr:hypothetical protein PFDG_04872 [Plasmodium falciparum Dd2]
MHSDISFLLFHYLKYKGYDCICAPYLAISQLAYFLEINLVDIVFGPPTLGLHNATKIISNIVWQEKLFRMDRHIIFIKNVEYTYRTIYRCLFISRY